MKNSRSKARVQVLAQKIGVPTHKYTQAMHPEHAMLEDLLGNMYRRHKGLVSFIDESYSEDREGGSPFYLIAATVIEIDQLEHCREAYRRVVPSGRWHTTDANHSGEQRQIHDFIQVLSSHNSYLIAAIQLAIQSGALEHARRECLVQAVSALASSGCHFVVYERRETTKDRRLDESLFRKAKADGLISREIKTFAASPGSENLLWGADLAGWAVRRYITKGERLWFEPLLSSCEVIDVGENLSLKKKGPEPALAMDPGLGPSEGLFSDEKERSSLKSMTRITDNNQVIFSVFPKVSKPLHDPLDLSDWIRVQFTK